MVYRLFLALQVGSDREFSLDELRERPHAVANALSHQ